MKVNVVNVEGIAPTPTSVLINLWVGSSWRTANVHYTVLRCPDVGRWVVYFSRHVYQIIHWQTVDPGIHWSPHLASWRLRRLWQTRPTRRTRPSRPTRPRSSPCQCRSQKGWFQTVLYVDVTMANGNELLLKCENVDTTKDTWSCRCCHHFGSVVTYLKQFMRPEISHQVGEAHEILVIGEANASHFLFSYTAM